MASSSATLCISRRISLVSKDTGGLYIGISYSTDVCSRHSSRAAFSLDATEAGASDSNAPQFTRWGSLPVSTSRHTVCNKTKNPMQISHARGSVMQQTLWLGASQWHTRQLAVKTNHKCILQNLLWQGVSWWHTRWRAVRTNHNYILFITAKLGASLFAYMTTLWTLWQQDDVLWKPVINTHCKTMIGSITVAYMTTCSQNQS